MYNDQTSDHFNLFHPQWRQMFNMNQLNQYRHIRKWNKKKRTNERMNGP